MISNPKQAAQLYIGAWDRLAFSDFFSALHVDCHYASQYVFEELESKDTIVDYLSGKIQTIKESGHKVKAKLATLITGASLNTPPGTPCVAMLQGNSPEIAAVVFFQVSDGKIDRFDLCMPELYEVTIDD
jgi:hypothetical protein